VDVMNGSLVLRGAASAEKTLFAPDSGIRSATWSPDSQQLISVEVNGSKPAQLWQVTLTHQQVSAPRVVFTSTAADNPEGLVLGDWSPNSRYLLFWTDPMMSASILADGTPLRIWDSQTGAVQLITNEGPLGQATAALLNARYHSWAPDSSALAVTLGGYRSAQINKWLALYHPSTGATTVVVSDTEQIPGIVAWAPQGDLIAYAAVPAAETSQENADLTTFDNPAIAGRRIYLLDPQTGKHWRLNDAEVFQDAPIWQQDGSVLYYVQRQEDQAVVMSAHVATKQFQQLPAAAQPLSAVEFYYGQFDWKTLLKSIGQ